jgi:hypothetical protein
MEVTVEDPLNPAEVTWFTANVAIEWSSRRNDRPDL